MKVTRSRLGMAVISWELSIRDESSVNGVDGINYWSFVRVAFSSASGLVDETL